MVFPILQKKLKPEETNNWPPQLMKGRSGCPIATNLPTVTQIEEGFIVSGSSGRH